MGYTCKKNVGSKGFHMYACKLGHGCRERVEWTSHVATTAAQQVKSAGGIPTAPLLIEVMVTEEKM